MPYRWMKLRKASAKPLVGKPVAPNHFKGLLSLHEVLKGETLESMTNLSGEKIAALIYRWGGNKVSVLSATPQLSYRFLTV
jgi:hypothetical protein